MKKTPKRGKKKAPASRAAGKGRVVVGKEYLDELLRLKTRLKKIARIINSAVATNL